MKSLEEIKNEYALYRHKCYDWNTYISFNDGVVTEEDLDCIAKLYAEELYNTFSDK